MDIGTGERGPRTEMLEFKVTSKPELRFEHYITEGGTTEKELGLKISFMYWDSKR